MENKIAIILGAGPAGLTAALELLEKTQIKPIILEKEDRPGGISKTVGFNKALIDLGPHRFFTKSDRVFDFWQKILPDKNDFFEVSRQTRIIFENNFFDYPIALNLKTLRQLGFRRIIKIALSYLYVRFKPIKPEKSLADFYINRFGYELYKTFFKDYTQKVWGVGCEKIPADWGSQRVKGVSIKEVLAHAIKKIFKMVKNKNVQTSLIEKFYYPRMGAGQMYESLAKKIVSLGGEIYYNQKIISIDCDGTSLLNVKSFDLNNGQEVNFSGNYFLSSIPIDELAEYLKEAIDNHIFELAKNLIYRDYILVGFLFEGLKSEEIIKKIKDNWIYVQEKNLKMGRLDFVNNFSSAMLPTKQSLVVGAEYFSNQGDDLWEKTDEKIIKMAQSELKSLGLIIENDLVSAKVFRQKKAYPAYFGVYEKFNFIKEEFDKFDNLFLIGRNGMHHYNNMDHSILSAMTAVDNIRAGRKDKENIWLVNTEKEYHEVK